MRQGSPTRAARPQGAAAHGQGYRLQGRLLVGTTASSGSARRGGAYGNGTGPQERPLEGRGCRLHRSDDNGLLEWRDGSMEVIAELTISWREITMLGDAVKI
ncbi:hypothetical protein B296_00018297 [Ensete ventricosum]|uniref:Uncharacterized protein n=1 Tax=Ensete ventricosum TaxID=4639 RepID=A0A426ZPH8_ENSVE|nr:hypothetical protein B296_00018297 [Ensete ventricosum]